MRYRHGRSAHAITFCPPLRMIRTDQVATADLEELIFRLLPSVRSPTWHLGLPITLTAITWRLVTRGTVAIYRLFHPPAFPSSPLDLATVLAVRCVAAHAVLSRADWLLTEFQPPSALHPPDLLAAITRSFTTHPDILVRLVVTEASARLNVTATDTIVSCVRDHLPIFRSLANQQPLSVRLFFPHDKGEF